MVRADDSRLVLFLAMPRDQKRIFLQAAMAMPLFRLAVVILGYSRIRRQLDSMNAGQRKENVDPRDLRQFAKRVNQAASVTLGAGNCLTRSLVLQWMLARRDIVTDLRIGVQTKGKILTAHAWVEKNGIPINDRSDIGDEYAVFDQPMPSSTFR